LRTVDPRTASEVRSLLSADPVLLAVPRTAENRPRECSYAIDPLRYGVIRARRVGPIGPWCVCWWERFSAGFRLELELGDPSAD
jgi:hypothetical protein